MTPLARGADRGQDREALGVCVGSNIPRWSRESQRVSSNLLELSVASAFAISLVVAAVWLVTALRGWSAARTGPFLRPPTTPPEPGVDHDLVEAIVPARNEESGIRATIEGLLGQDYPNFHVLVVNDRSTDRTGAILAELFARVNEAGPLSPRLRVLEGAERPAGWMGKTWALEQGVRASNADWLWFVDADMRLHPAALRAAWSEAIRQDVQGITCWPRLDCTTVWQSSVAVMFSLLLWNLYRARRVNDPAYPDAAAVGGFILVRRDAYLRAGGHAAVRGDVVEDVALAYRLKERGAPLRLLAAGQLASTHMYGDLRAIFQGLRKNAYAGMGYHPGKYGFLVIMGLAMGWAPWAALALGLLEITGMAPAVLMPKSGAGFFSQPPGGSWLTVAAVGLLAQMAAAWPVVVFHRLKFWTAACFPLGITLYAAIATASLIDHYQGVIEWKGDRIQRQIHEQSKDNAS